MPPQEQVTPKNETPFYQDVNFDWQFLFNKRLIVNHTIIGTDAATAANYGIFWIAPFAVFVLNVYEVHQTLGTDGSAVTLDIERLQGTEALDAGDDLMATTFDLKGTINTVLTGSLINTATGRPTRRLSKGDRLAMNDTGTLTTVANVTVTVELLVI